MTRFEAEQFRERWRLVKERQAEERRQSSIEDRYQQMAALMSTAIGLGWKTHRQDEVERVRQLWGRLRALYRE